MILVKILYIIKNKHPKFWTVIELVNSTIFGFLFSSKFNFFTQNEMEKMCTSRVKFRHILESDLMNLRKLLDTIEPENVTFFEPHEFTETILRKQLKNKGFLMYGAFNDTTLVGYFFIRAGINRKCFIGRYIHPNYRLQGIGKQMNQILYHTAWRAGFRVFATISPQNQLVTMSHHKNPHFRYVKMLETGYWLVEFVDNPV